MKNKLFIAAISIFAIELACMYLFRYPYAPYSFIALIPSFLFSEIIGEPYGVHIGITLGSSVPAIVFFFYAKHSIKYNLPLTKVSIYTFAIVFVLSLANTLEGFESTVRFTSQLRAYTLVVMSSLPPMLLIFYCFLCRSSFSLTKGLMCLWVGFIWLGCFSFPWYGELP